MPSMIYGHSAVQQCIQDSEKERAACIDDGSSEVVRVEWVDRSLLHTRTSDPKTLFLLMSPPFAMKAGTLRSVSVALRGLRYIALPRLCVPALSNFLI